MEPELYDPCKSDISRLCPNVNFGNAQVRNSRDIRSNRDSKNIRINSRRIKTCSEMLEMVNQNLFPLSSSFSSTSLTSPPSSSSDLLSSTLSLSSLSSLPSLYAPPLLFAPHFHSPASPLSSSLLYPFLPLLPPSDILPLPPHVHR